MNSMFITCDCGKTYSINQHNKDKEIHDEAVECIKFEKPKKSNGEVVFSKEMFDKLGVMLMTGEFGEDVDEGYEDINEVQHNIYYDFKNQIEDEIYEQTRLGDYQFLEKLNNFEKTFK